MREPPQECPKTLLASAVEIWAIQGNEPFSASSPNQTCCSLLSNSESLPTSAWHPTPKSATHGAATTASDFHLIMVCSFFRSYKSHEDGEANGGAGSCREACADFW